MKKLITILLLPFMLITVSKGQYNNKGIIISAGANYSKYLGKGEGQNMFKDINPGFQIELTTNNGKGVEWIIWGFARYSASNYVGKNNVPVTFTIPYYTEFLFYQKEKKHPFFWFFGYDYLRMLFPEMEEADNHHNLTFGGGLNYRLTDRLFLQLKLKPYFVIGNSIGQKFGFNSLINLHYDLK